MRLRFLPAAELELVRELAYYLRASRGAAERFQSSVEAAAQMAARHSQGGAPAYKETRTYRIKGFPFSLVYRASAQEILVVAIAPHAKKPNYWAARIGAS